MAKKQAHHKKSSVVIARFGLSDMEEGLRQRVMLSVLSVAILALGIIVPIAIYRSLAATGVAAYEAESGTKTGGAINGTDSNASGGSFVQFTPAASGYDFVVTAVSTSPASPTDGQAVTFSATIKNIGTGASPAGTQLGVGFWVDSVKTVWSDNFTGSLAAGQSTTVTATGGPAGSSTWPATAGTHSVDAYVDDINRFPNETNENNNHLIINLNVGGGGGTTGGTIGSQWGGSAVFYLGWLDPSVRNFVYSHAKTEGINWIRADVTNTGGDQVWPGEALAAGLHPLVTIHNQDAPTSITIANQLYSVGVRVIMLRNEDNTSGESASSYISYFNTVYGAIHGLPGKAPGSHPDMEILTTGLAQNGENPPSYPKGQSTWLKAFCDAGIFNYDNVGVGIHWYYDDYDPGVVDNVDAQWRGLTAKGLAYFFGIIDNCAHTNHPKIWITEEGDPRSANDAATQAFRVPLAYNVNSSWLKPWRDRLGPIFWFSIINKNEGGSREQSFGGWSQDGATKYPVADSVKSMLSQPIQ